MVLFKRLNERTNYHTRPGNVVNSPDYSNQKELRKSGNQADVMVADDHNSALRLSLLLTSIFTIRFLTVIVSFWIKSPVTFQRCS